MPWSTTHCARHVGSPLHLLTQASYGAHVASAVHATDSVQQLARTHDAHAAVPYGKPHASVVTGPPASCARGSSNPTI